MIESISIDNYALIDKSIINFKKGFTVITGETGAGKSIMIGALGLTLGERSDASVIPNKNRKCIIEVVYDIANYDLKSWFDKNNLDFSTHVIVRRELRVDGKSRGFINDTPVYNKILKEFGAFMIDIHSQHKSLLIGRPEFQTEILDLFCGNKDLLKEYTELFKKRELLLKNLVTLKQEFIKEQNDKDYLNFRYDQLDKAKLELNEKENLEQELTILNNAEAIKENLAMISWQIYGMDDSILQSLKICRDKAESLENMIKGESDYVNRIKSVMIELQDIADDAENRSTNIEYNVNRIEVINDRLSLLYELLKKHNCDTIEELIAIKEDISTKLNNISNKAEDIVKLEAEVKKVEERMDKLALEISKSRIYGASILRKKMTELLKELGILHADFIIDIKPLVDFTISGKDKIEFLFAANKNQTPGEIFKVASGGEISRVMMSLKYILSKSRDLPTIIFDEIDTGLSGDIAHKMSFMMKDMSKNMQVISISHLPQIASVGQYHYKVYKEDKDDYTVSKIKELSYDERLKEIAGMISGSVITKAAIETAKNLLK